MRWVFVFLARNGTVGVLADGTLSTLRFFIGCVVAMPEEPGKVRYAAPQFLTLSRDVQWTHPSIKHWHTDMPKCCLAVLLKFKGSRPVKYLDIFA